MGKRQKIIAPDHTILVDSEDLGLLSEYHWYVDTNRGNLYAVAAHTSSGAKLPRKIKLHRLVLGVANSYRKTIVDHINGNGLDNRKANLRKVTPSQNRMNMRKKTTQTSSRYKGVYRRAGKWVAQIRSKELGTKYLGRFKEEVDAAIAYNRAAVTYFGPFASLNRV